MAMPTSQFALAASSASSPDASSNYVVLIGLQIWICQVLRLQLSKRDTFLRHFIKYLPLLAMISMCWHMAPLPIAFANILQEAFFIGNDSRRRIWAALIDRLNQASSICSLHVVITIINSTRSLYLLYKCTMGGSGHGHGRWCDGVRWRPS